MEYQDFYFSTASLPVLLDEDEEALPACDLASVKSPKSVASPVEPIVK